jgi:hypothetical protein
VEHAVSVFRVGTVKLEAAGFPEGFSIAIVLDGFTFQKA